ncbi:hypothetical protein BGZ81_009448 [Podila clonocystis]|nr:hypothetical protein BGZ81_009448 [Podila clonocystis]
MLATSLKIGSKESEALAEVLKALKTNTTLTTLDLMFRNLPKDTGGVQQVVINVGDDNFCEIFPKKHVEFIDWLKNVATRSTEDDGDDDDRTKKQKNRSSAEKRQANSNIS